MKPSRRNFLKGSASLAGLMVVPMAGACETREPDSPANRAQRAYLEAVLHKHAGRSRRSNAAHIATFAQRFTDTYGVVDYRQMYGGLVGEYRLTRLFVRSLMLAA